MTAETLRNLKHDLRTSVNHILGYGDLLLESADETGNTAMAAVAEGVIEQGKVLATAVEKTFHAQLHDKINEAVLGALRHDIKPVVARILAVLPSSRESIEIPANQEDMERIRRAATQMLIVLDIPLTLETTLTQPY